MAGPSYVLDKPYKTSAAIRKYRAVEISGAEIVTECNAANDRVWGICQEEVSTADGTAGRIANIRLMGVSRCIAGAAIVIGATLTIDNQGRVVTSPVAVGTTYAVVGMAMQAAAAAGDHIDVLLTPGAINNTALT